MTDVDFLIGNLAPGLPATIPAHDLTVPEPAEVYDTNQGGNTRSSDLFRLGVVPDRDYRLELRVPETTDGRPANVSFIVFRGYIPYFDLGDENEVTGGNDLQFLVGGRQEKRRSQHGVQSATLS